MTDELKYTVSLGDNVSVSAKAASASLVSLQSELGKAKKELIALQGEQLQYKRGGFKSAASDMSTDIAKARHNIAILQSGISDTKSLLGAAPKKESWFHQLYDAEVLRRSLRSVGAGINELGMGLRNLDAKEVLGGTVESIAGVAEGLDMLVPGLGTAASAVVKLAGAFAGAALGAVEFALEVNSVNRRLESTFSALGGGPAAGKAAMSMFNDLSKTLPQSREQLAEWTKEFQGMGITDLDKVRAHLVATAGAAAIMGESGAEAYIKLEEKARLATETQKGGSGLLKLGEKPLERLYKAGVNVTDIARKMGMGVRQLSMGLEAGTINAQRFGEALESTLIEKGRGPLDAMMAALDVLERKGLETLAHLFDDIDTTPLTSAIQSVIELGDQGEPSGAALHSGIVNGLNGIMIELGHAITQGEIFFLKLELGALKSGFSLRAVVQDIKDMATAAEIAAKPFMMLFKGAAWVADQYVWAAGKIGFEASDAIANNEARRTAELKAHPMLGDELPGHASGGVITGIRGGLAMSRPAPGEGLASVGVGERIVPANFGRGGFGAGSFGNMRQDSSGGGRSVHVETIHVHIDAPHGVTDATAITVTGLTVALERMQLASGR